MPAEVDAGLATLSDQLILATVLLYLFAMIGYALELAFGRTAAGRPGRVRARSRHGRRPARGRAGRPGGRRRRGAAAGPAPPAWPVWRRGRVAVGLSWLGWAGQPRRHRHPRPGRGPVAVGQHVRVRGRDLLRRGDRVPGHAAPPPRPLPRRVRHGRRRARARLRRHGTCTCRPGPVVPALNSYWVAIHVTAAIIASGLFIVAGVAGILYLVRGGRPRSGCRPGRTWSGSPTGPS